MHYREIPRDIRPVEAPGQLDPARPDHASVDLIVGRQLHGIESEGKARIGQLAEVHRAADRPATPLGAPHDDVVNPHHGAVERKLAFHSSVVDSRPHESKAAAPQPDRPLHVDVAGRSPHDQRGPSVATHVFDLVGEQRSQGQRDAVSIEPQVDRSFGDGQAKAGKAQVERQRAVNPEQLIAHVPHRRVESQPAVAVVESPRQVRVRHSEQVAVVHLESRRDHRITHQTGQLGIQLETPTDREAVRPKVGQVRQFDTRDTGGERRRPRDTDGALQQHSARSAPELETPHRYSAVLIELKLRRLDQFPIRAPEP